MQCTLTRPICAILTLVFFGGLSILGAQSSEQRYTGDIRETDPRVREIVAGMRSGGAAPEEIRLRYGGKRGDYLAFYDLEGRYVYFRYREDRFDRRAEKKIVDLIEGQAYRVRGNFRGLVLDGVFFSGDAPTYQDALKQSDCILAYDYDRAYPLRLDQILY